LLGGKRMKYDSRRENKGREESLALSSGLSFGHKAGDWCIDPTAS